jgi:hypothetical protein
VAPLAALEKKKFEAGVERGTTEFTEHVSKSMKKSLDANPMPTIPPKPQRRPLMQVLSWAKGAGPIKVNLPMSIRNSSPMLHWNPLGTPVLFVILVPFA